MAELPIPNKGRTHLGGEPNRTANENTRKPSAFTNTNAGVKTGGAPRKIVPNKFRGTGSK